MTMRRKRPNFIVTRNDGSQVEVEEVAVADLEEGDRILPKNKGTLYPDRGPDAEASSVRVVVSLDTNENALILRYKSLSGKRFRTVTAKDRIIYRVVE